MFHSQGVNMSEQERAVRRTIKTEQTETTESTPVTTTVTIDPFEVSHEAFMKFVEAQIERMNNSLLFKDREPSMYELQQSLANWESVWFGLVSLYESARWEFQEAKEKFDEWWSIKFMEIKRRENSPTAKRNMWLSATEIENTVRSENVEEMRQMKSAILDAESRKDMMSRLMSGWESYNFILSRLSQNSCAEIQGSIRHVDMARGDETE
jgi:hypothetical protein